MHEDSVPPDDQAPEGIERLEDRIAALSDTIARCRKIAAVARLLIGAGAAVLVLWLLGMVMPGPQMLLTGLSAVIGGIVLAGSNTGTWRQAESALDAAEALRRDLIGRMELRVVGDERATLH